MADIFLSHSHEDVAIAQRFAKGFERAGFTVWWDRTLHSGDPYDRVTEQALKEAKAVVVLWSKKSVESRWVRSEATIGYRHRTLAPVMIEPCERPIMFELSHTVDLSHWSGDPSDKVWKSYLADVRQFVEGHAEHEKEAAEAAAAAAAEASTTKIRRLDLSLSRRGLIIGALVLIAVIGVATAWRAGMFGPAKPEFSSIAVLPFSNISGDPEQNYLSDGVAAEIRARLARNSSLQVVAQTSSNLFRDNKSDAKQISQKLDVTFLLDGNVRRSGDRVRIVTELINGRTGFSAWSQTFERSLSDIFAVQSEIAQAVVQALSAEVAARGVDNGGTSPGASPDRLDRRRTSRRTRRSCVATGCIPWPQARKPIGAPRPHSRRPSAWMRTMGRPTRRGRAHSRSSRTSMRSEPSAGNSMKRRSSRPTPQACWRRTWPMHTRPSGLRCSPDALMWPELASRMSGPMNWARAMRMCSTGSHSTARGPGDSLKRVRRLNVLRPWIP